jgi:carboxymethylenebutenolidase
LGESIKLRASDGHEFNAYRAAPDGAAKGGVVVIQEIWGVNRWVRSVVDRYARHGYLAVAPALFDRLEMGFESDDYVNGYARIREKREGYDPALGLLDIGAAVGAVQSAGRVGITGYCFGGMMSWRAAHAGLGLSAASGYYGGGIPNYVGLAPKIPTEMHYGGRDNGIPLEQVEQLRARYPEVDVYVYEAGHGFCCSERPRDFDEASCLKASARTLEFFRKHLA